MKKIIASLAGLLLFAQVHAAPTEIIVSAAASLTDAMNELIVAYQKVAPDVKVTPTYGSSGSLQKQIEQGAPADLFFSAAPKQMNALQQQGLIATETRVDLLENSVVLIVPKGNKIGLTKFEELATPKVKQIALGEPTSVPVGQYSEDIFKNLALLDAVKGKAVYAKDVRQVLTYVEMGEVDAGIVYATDATISDKVQVVAVAAAGSHAPIVYPAAVVKASTNPKAAGAFLQWLKSPAAKTVFQKYGFVTK